MSVRRPERPDQLGRDEGDVRRIARGRDRPGQRRVVVEQHRPVPRGQRATGDLQPRDVRHRQRQHPRPRAAEPRGRRGARRQHGPPRQHDPLGLPRRPRRLDHDRLRLGRLGQPGVELVDGRGEKHATNASHAWNNRVGAHLDRADAASEPPRSAAVVPVDPLRDRRGCVPHRQRGVLHPHRRAVRRPGRSGPDHRGPVVVRVRGAAGPVRRPGRAQAGLGGRRADRGGAVPRVAVARGVLAVPRHGRRARDRSAPRAARRVGRTR